ncbi:MAG: HAMP domain-containing protein [Firmicutes bacterium]|nr:HAMP domain-containing protein [Bacillota bacterium]
MRKFSLGSGLGQKLLVWFCIMSLAPAILIAVVSYQNSSKALTMQLEKDLTGQARILGLQVDRYINEKLHELMTLSRRAVFTSEDRPLDEKAAALYEAVGDEIACAYIVDAAGSVLASAGGLDPGSVAGEAWFSAIQSGDLYFGDCAMSESAGRPTIKIAAPIMSPDGRFLGVIVEEVDMGPIRGMMDEVEKTQKGIIQSGYAFLVNKDGLIIDHPDKTKIFKEKPAELGIPGLTEAIRNVLAGKEGMSRYIYGGVQNLIVYAPLSGYGDYKGSGWGIGIAVPAIELFRPITGLRDISVVAILAVGLVAVFIAVILSRGIARPLRRIADVAEAVAEGNLAVAVPEVRTRDEVGVLTKAFSRMLSGLRNLVGELHSSAEQVFSTSEQLSASSGESAKSIQQISEALQQVSSGAQEQSATIANGASSVNQLTQAIGQVAKGAEAQVESIQSASKIMRETDKSLDEVLGMLEKVGSVSSENAKAAAKGSESVKNVVTSMDRIRSTTEDVAESIRELDNHSREIGRILEVIDEIAEQTNLLALNAAIEAARAGEHGRGFAVVADEVRKLAERSSRETKAIADLIGSVRQATEKAVSAIDSGTKEVEAGSLIAQEAGSALDAIYSGASGAEQLLKNLLSSARTLKDAALNVGKSINEIVSIAEENTAAAEEMAAGAEEVKKAIENAVAVSEESAAAVEEVSASTEEVNASIQEMSASAESLAEMAQRLQNLVTRFKL